MVRVNATRAQQIGEAVRAARRRVGYTQAELSAMVGVSLKTITNVEKGSVDASPQTIRSLEDALGVDLSAGALTATATADVVCEAIRSKLGTLNRTDQIRFVAAMLSAVDAWRSPSEDTRSRIGNDEDAGRNLG